MMNTYNTIILLHGSAVLTTKEFRKTLLGDRVFGVDSDPEEIARWPIAEEGGLHWSYGVDFEFEGHTDGWLSVKNDYGTFASVTFGENRWDDCKTLKEAYYLVTKQAIKSANYTY